MRTRSGEPLRGISAVCDLFSFLVLVVTIVAISVTVTGFAIIIFAVLLVVISATGSFHTASYDTDQRAAGTFQLTDGIMYHFLRSFASADNQDCTVAEGADFLSV